MEPLCLTEIFACFLLSVLYVGSLYIWNATDGRDHPKTIKKRCISVFFMTLLSPAFIIMFATDETRNKASLWELMGIRSEGILPALILPPCLTMILFLGPILQNHENMPLSATIKLYTDPRYWLNMIKNPIWMRNQIVAPFSEEFTFRACMLPILLQCVSPGRAVFIAPLFFGVAHLHHAVDKLRNGLDLQTTIIMSCFQFSYTSLFGFYSTFLFIRTGHFLPLFAVHAFCNHLGLPDIRELLSKPLHCRIKLMVAHIVGLVCWYFLLYPLTNPTLYANNLYTL